MTPIGMWLMTPAVTYASVTTVFTGIQDYNNFKKLGGEGLIIIRYNHFQYTYFFHN